MTEQDRSFEPIKLTTEQAWRLSAGVRYLELYIETKVSQKWCDEVQSIIDKLKADLDKQAEKGKISPETYIATRELEALIRMAIINKKHAKESLEGMKDMFSGNSVKGYGTPFDEYGSAATIKKIIDGEAVNPKLP